MYAAFDAFDICRLLCRSAHPPWAVGPRILMPPVRRASERRLGHYLCSHLYHQTSLHKAFPAREENEMACSYSPNAELQAPMNGEDGLPKRSAVTHPGNTPKFKARVALLAEVGCPFFSADVTARCTGGHDPNGT